MIEVHELVFHALVHEPSMLVVYQELCWRTRYEPLFETVEAFAEHVGYGVWTVKRCLRMLAELGLAQRLEKNPAGVWGIDAPEEISAEAAEALVELAAGRLRCDVRNTQLFDANTGAVVARGATALEGVLQHPVAEHEATALTGPVATLTLAESSTTASASEKRAIYSSSLVRIRNTRSSKYEGAKPRKSAKKYNPKTDEYREAVLAVQAYANQLFKTTHGILNAKGEEIGRTAGVSGRYGVIRRALVDWGFSEEQLKGALLVASKDAWWAERKINDTTKLLRKLEHVQRWVDLWAAGGKLPATKWDKKQPELAFSKAAKDGVLDRSKLTEEVF